MKKPKTIFIGITICIIGIFILPLAGSIDAEKTAKIVAVDDGKLIKPAISEQKTDVESNEIINKELKFIIPIKGKITSLYGWRKHPITGKKNFHNGIDIASPKGTLIYASASGKVIEAGFRPEWGNLIIIKHNNSYSTAYGQCDKILVKEGQTVKSGDTIATCGMSGIATGNHLHFEIRKNGTAIDPYKYLFNTDLKGKGEKSMSLLSE